MGRGELRTGAILTRIEYLLDVEGDRSGPNKEHHVTKDQWNHG